MRTVSAMANVSDASQKIQELSSKIQRAEDTTRKLLRLVKQYADAVLALHKLENKCASDLLQAPLCSSSKHAHAPLKATVRHWAQALNTLDADCKHLNASCSKNLSTPLKEFLDVLSIYHKALRKRESVLQEHERAVARWKKVEKEGKFSVTTAKYNEIRAHVVETELAVESMHKRLLQDLSTLSAKSGDFFQPVLLSFADIQRQHNAAAYDTLGHMLAGHTPPITERTLEEDLRRYRGQLEALSIVQGPTGPP